MDKKQDGVRSPDGVHCVTCPKQVNKIKGVVLNRVSILRFFFPKQGQGFKPSAAHLYSNIGRVPPLPEWTVYLVAANLKSKKLLISVGKTKRIRFIK